VGYVKTLGAMSQSGDLSQISYISFRDCLVSVGPWHSARLILGNPSVLQQQSHELEHRWGERFAASLPILIMTDVISGAAGIITDISLSGALLQSSVDLRLRSLVWIRFEAPSNSRRSTFIQAHVVRKASGGVAVEFCDFAPRTIKDLLRSLSSHVDRGRDAAPGDLLAELGDNAGTAIRKEME
jgi:hypothetical protein